MFTKLKVTQSMLDAVNLVINEKKMDEADLDETGLRKAAYAAHTAGQKMFTFKGKTYPVKVQGEDVSYGEAVKEAASGVVTHTKTGLVHKSTKAYGGSKPEKHPIDTLKGPKTKDLIKKDVEDYKKSKGRYDEEYSFKSKLIEGWKMKKEELKGQQHKIDKNKNDKIDAQDFAILRGEKKMKEEIEVDEAVRRSDIPASVRKARGDAPLTPAEVKAPAKDSISASANLAKARNEEVEEIEEVKKPTGQLKDACWKGYTAVGMKMKGGRKVPNCVPEEVELDEKAGYSAKAARAGKDIGKPGKAFAQIAKSAGERYGSAEKGKKVAGAILAKLRKEEIEEHTEEYTEEQLDEMINEVLGKDATAGDWIHDFVHSDNPKFAGKSKEKRKKMALAAYYAKQRNEGVENPDSHPITTDTLLGRMPGGKINSFKSFKIRVRPLDKEGEQSPKDATPKIIQPDETPARKSHETKQTLKTEGKRPEMDDSPEYVPFEKPYKSLPGEIKDKSGAVHTPMSRAKDLAKAAMKKIKTEMLGKIGTSESKK